jgi:hypothetical protein
MINVTRGNHVIKSFVDQTGIRQHEYESHETYILPWTMHINERDRTTAIAIGCVVRSSLFRSRNCPHSPFDVLRHVSSRHGSAFY